MSKTIVVKLTLAEAKALVKNVPATAETYSREGVALFNAVKKIRTALAQEESSSSEGGALPRQRRRVGIPKDEPPATPKPVEFPWGRATPKPVVEEENDDTQRA